MLLILMVMAALLAGCAPAPAPTPVDRPKADLTLDPSYGQAVERLNGLTREAEKLLEDGDPELAGKRLAEGQAVMQRLLAVSRPTLAAMEAVSDSDRLYSRMLLGNRHYGWARLVFQKEEKRWKAWKPQTEESARRLKAAVAGIAECDRHLGSE